MIFLVSRDLDLQGAKEFFEDGVEKSKIEKQLQRKLLFTSKEYYGYKYPASKIVFCDIESRISSHPTAIVVKRGEVLSIHDLTFAAAQQQTQSSMIIEVDDLLSYIKNLASKTAQYNEGFTNKKEVNDAILK